jgi:hypothetical protein
MKVCAIHQPNFFPWLGYFDKIRRSDVFVFLDSVAYPKSGHSMGSWCNRVRIDIGGNPTWFGCAVKREHGEQKIRDVLLDDGRPWRERLLNMLRINYRRSPGFVRTMALVEPLILSDEDRLAAFNIRAIKAVCNALEINASFVRQSDLNIEGSSTELLVSITRAVGCDTYMSGGGATEYQVDGLFRERGVDLVYQDFVQKPYRKQDDFLPGLSVLDYLMFS